MIEIKLGKGESLERALKRLKRQVDREGVLTIARERRHYEKKSSAKYKKQKKAKYVAKLQAEEDRRWNGNGK
jgi:small subunit ribosomal protein S21